MPSLNEQRARSGARLALARSKALDAYASVEQGLCSVLSRLTNTDAKYTSIIFYRTGTHPRNVILDDLMKAEYGDQYQPFWDTLMKRVRSVDQTRNMIVHWHTSVNISAERATVVLSKPSTWYSNGDISQITAEEIDTFMAECDFVSRLLSMFDAFLSGALRKDKAAYSVWLEIFQQPVVYPPPDTHPLFPTWNALQSRLNHLRRDLNFLLVRALAHGEPLSSSSPYLARHVLSSFPNLLF